MHAGSLRRCHDFTGTEQIVNVVSDTCAPLKPQPLIGFPLIEEQSSFLLRFVCLPVN